jgi:glycosyltransferase involved in cell wall biosynthesis
MVDVSIIIPNKNGAKHLHDCLGSVVVPTDFSYEVCVVDDGSTDESWEILNYYRTQFPNRFYFYQSPGSGAAAARNFGFQQSSGQYIQFLDADDQLGPGKIQTQLDCLQWAVSGTP